MKACFYAINGHGLGHLSRSYAIAKRLKALLHSIDEEADIQFLTTSQADHLIHDFPVFKIPSRSMFKGQRGAASRYTRNGKMMVSNMIAHFSPHLLIMDTIATGSFNEFSFIKSMAKKTVLIERHKKEVYAKKEAHLAHLPLFDSILVPEEKSLNADYNIPKHLLTKVHYCDRIHGIHKADLLSRSEARSYFGVSTEPLIYLAAGGGGDPAAQLQIETLLHALSTLPVKVIIGYGPLNHTPKQYNSSQFIPFTELGISRYFKGFDLAISAAGYNTYEELLCAKVPTAFFAQDKGMDDQSRRVAHGTEQHWHYALDLDQNLRSQLNSLLSSRPPAELNNRPSPHGAIKAALHLAELHYESQDEKCILLRLSAEAWTTYEQEEWSHNSPAEVISTLMKVLKYASASQRIRLTINTTELLSLIEICMQITNTLAQLQLETSSERSRLLTHIAKTAAGNITTLSQWIQSNSSLS